MPQSKASSFSRRAVLSSLLGLVVILTLENWLYAPLSITRWLIQILPLLAFIPALLRDNSRPYQWLCFIILLYFMVGILTVFTPGKLLTGLAQSFFCVLLFSSAIFYIRKQQKVKHSDP